MRRREALHDISIHKRIDWVMTDIPLHPRLKPLAESAVRRLRRQAARAKYPVFFYIKPLVRCPLDTAPKDLSDDMLVQEAIISLRLTALMRSMDEAHVVSGLWTHENRAFVNTTDKAHQQRTISITGWTLELIVEYLWWTRQFPCPFPFRQLHDRSKPLSRERISKLAKLMMLRCGSNPAFQPHSLRGPPRQRCSNACCSCPLLKRAANWRMTSPSVYTTIGSTRSRL